ncbi:MAG: DUF3192 domain-containing protein [Gammaproteobacteria bacterium]
MYTQLAVAALATVMASGCVLVVADGEVVGNGNGKRESAMEQQKYNRVAVPKIAIGTAIEDVRDDLGEPHFAEAFAREDGEYRVLFYRTHRTRQDGDTTRDETTPVVFRDGSVIGIGDDFYRRLTGG